jgi:hypothetical protein
VNQEEERVATSKELDREHSESERALGDEIEAEREEWETVLSLTYSR